MLYLVVYHSYASYCPAKIWFVHLYIWSGYGPGVPLPLLDYTYHNILYLILFIIIYCIDYRNIEDNLHFVCMICCRRHYIIIILLYVMCALFDRGFYKLSQSQGLHTRYGYCRLNANSTHNTVKI